MLNLPHMNSGSSKKDRDIIAPLVIGFFVLYVIHMLLSDNRFFDTTWNICALISVVASMLWSTSQAKQGGESFGMQARSLMPACLLSALISATLSMIRMLVDPFAGFNVAAVVAQAILGGIKVGLMTIPVVLVVSFVRSKRNGS